MAKECREILSKRVGEWLAEIAKLLDCQAHCPSGPPYTLGVTRLERLEREGWISVTLIYRRGFINEVIGTLDGWLEHASNLITLFPTITRVGTYDIDFSTIRPDIDRIREAFRKLGATSLIEKFARVMPNSSDYEELSKCYLDYARRQKESQQKSQQEQEQTLVK